MKTILFLTLLCGQLCFAQTIHDLPSNRVITTRRVLQKLHPEMTEGVDYTIKGDGTIQTWTPTPWKPRPAPSKLDKMRVGIIAKIDAEKLRKVWPTKAEFWAEFTDAEKLAIMNSTIEPIRLLDRELLVWPGEVWSDDERVQAGLNGLVAVGILSSERKAAILAK